MILSLVAKEIDMLPTYETLRAYANRHGFYISSHIERGGYVEQAHLIGIDGTSHIVGAPALIAFGN